MRSVAFVLLIGLLPFRAYAQQPLAASLKPAAAASRQHAAAPIWSSSPQLAHCCSLRNVLKGMLIGAGVGAALTYLLDDSRSRGTDVLKAAALFGASGAAIGLLTDRSQRIFPIAGSRRVSAASPLPRVVPGVTATLTF